MKTRFIIGLILAALITTVLCIGGLALSITIYLFLAIAVFEVWQAFHHVGIDLSRSALVFFVVMLPFSIHYFGIKGILALLMVTGILIFVTKVLRADLTLVSTSYTFFALFYPCLMMSMLPMMLTFPGEAGRLALVVTLVCACVTDMFAYFAGLLFGKHKLCPKISPKKTVEGAIGGTLGGIVASVLVGYLIQPVLGTSVSLLHMAMLGLVSAVAGQIGDLSASLVKRNVGIKDFGKIFPGHGGVMDRLDSILFVAPIVYCYFSLVLLAAWRGGV